MDSTSRFLCLATAGLSTIVALAQPAPPRSSGLVDLRTIRDANAPDATPERFVLHDIVFFLNGEPMALITDLGRPPGMTMFCRADLAPPGCIMKEITRERVVLVDRRSGREVELKVRGASAADPATSAGRTKDWLNSKDNPMLHHFVEPPYGIYDDWVHLSEGQKEEMTAFYASYGWRFRAEIIAGTLDVTWERTNAADRLAEAQSYRDAFANSLSSEQRQAWQQIQSYPRIYATNGAYTEEQRAAIAKRDPIIKNFHASFTPEQRAAFDRMYSHPVTPPGVRPRDANYVLVQLLPAASAAPGAPAPYTKAWINSHANPMLHRPEWSSELNDRWSTLSVTDKIQVLEYFQKHGWQAIHLITTSGLTGQMGWRNIYAEERQAVLKAKYDAFSASLSPEQRQIWRSGKLNQTVFVANGVPDYARNRNPPEQQRIFEPFWTSLTVAQQAAYTELHDFTKADWK